MSENTQEVNPMQDFEENYKEMMQQGIEQMGAQFEQEVPNEYEPIFPGVTDSPTWEDIELWKAQFPKSKIFVFNLVDDGYIVRTLNRVEYKALAAREDLNSITREEQIAFMCCLFPRLDQATMGEGGAGIPAAISQFVMEVSGFQPVQEVQRLA